MKGSFASMTIMTIILYFCGTKNKKTKKLKYTSRGRSLPITYCIPFCSFPKMLSWQQQGPTVYPFVPSQKCSHGSSRELRKYFLYLKYRHSSSWKNFLWQVDYFSRARTSSSRRVHVMYWERVSFPPVAICHVSFNMVEERCI